MNARNTVWDNMPPSKSGDDVVRFHGTFRSQPCEFGMTDRQLSTMLAVLGAPGVGKTQLILPLVRQIKKTMRPNDTLVIFDTKGDYAKELANKNDFILGKMPDGVNAEQVFWNIFTDAVFDAESTNDMIASIRQTTSALFAERRLTTTNIYFPNAARELLEAILCMMILEASEHQDYSRLNNRSCKSYFNSFNSMEKWKALAPKLRKYGFAQAATHLEAREASSIISEMASLVSEIFVSDFAQNGSFGAKRFVNRQHGTIFLEYDLAMSEVLKPVYSLLVDSFQEEKMSHVPDGKLYLILDEMRLIPFSKRIEDSCAFGRSQGLCLIFGIQSLTSLYASFGKEKADSILSCISNMIAFRVNDAESRTFIEQRCGKNLRPVSWEGRDMHNHEQLLFGNVAEDWDIARLDVGDAVVQFGTIPPFMFHFYPDK